MGFCIMFPHLCGGHHDADIENMKALVFSIGANLKSKLALTSIESEEYALIAEYTAIATAKLLEAGYGDVLAKYEVLAA